MAGRGRGWGARVPHCCGDRLHHTFDIAEHIVVPEPQHAVAARLKIGGSFRIARFIVLAAVEFNDEARGMAGEVCIVRADRCLTAEVGACDRQMAQVLPQHALGVRWLVTH